MIYNLGSINADYFYKVPRLPVAGETLAATSMSSGLGGKGANQSVAMALAGVEVRHIGAVGPDGQCLVERMTAAGIDTKNIHVSPDPTAHAVVMVDSRGENQIVIFPGANQDQNPEVIETALATGQRGDWLLLQNETSLQVETARIAAEKGMIVAYSAAPFDADAVTVLLPYLSLLIMNEVEAGQLTKALGIQLLHLPVANVLVTKGIRGADWHDTRLMQTVSIPAFPVTAVDTTGAGDTFTGYAIAGLSSGLSPQSALRRAAAAAAISVTRAGTADAIPTTAEVEAFLA
ncbi:ribokinase [Roseovarius sp. HI0049]|nr:ribokinase [Roseovarius sp. HI0049]